jgi:putative ABC transport system ATP-binding protein
VGGARIRVDHVSRAYGAAVVLDDVSFAVEPGELVALTGPSGSGKTTLLQLIGSLDRPTTGRILVDDVSVGELSHGVVFQRHYLLPALSAQDNVELPLLAAHTPRGERAERALELLEQVGLAGRARARPGELSGGERQRVAIARALAGRPRLILADEPTGALDSVASRKIWELLSDVCARDGATVIVASHDTTFAKQADREFRLRDGRMVPASHEQLASEGSA